MVHATITSLQNGSANRIEIGSYCQWHFALSLAICCHDIFMKWEALLRKDVVERVAIAKTLLSHLKLLLCPTQSVLNLASFLLQLD